MTNDTKTAVQADAVQEAPEPVEPPPELPPEPAPEPVPQASAPEPETKPEPEPEPDRVLLHMPVDVRSAALVVLAVLAGVFALRWAAAVFIPLMLSLLLSTRCRRWSMCSSAGRCRAGSARR